jgi:cephalosporin-C deacetylase-like acetyl esterase
MGDMPIRHLDWFEQWKKETGEREPNFSAMKSEADLPNLFRFDNGAAVGSSQDWERRKAEIRQLLCHYVLGTLPTTIPAIASAAILEERDEDQAVLRKVKVTYETNNQASFTMETMTPRGEGPFPVFLTQSNHRRWGLLALSRGYMVCIYPGADTDDQTHVFKEAYPECDWSLITRRAWLGSRALDYMLTLGEADPAKIAITGHSRNGKQSLVAAAFDERITAVVGSSPGVGGTNPFRFASEPAFAESVEFMTRQFPEWFHPRLRFFTGREDKLPIDIHGLLGLIAPRHCLISTAYNDSCENTFAAERNHLAGMEVYRFLHKDEALRMHWRNGSHETSAEHIQTYVDWFDAAFGRGIKRNFPDERIHRFDWESWKAHYSAKELSDWMANEHAGIQGKDKARATIISALGDAPPHTVEAGGLYGAIPGHASALLNHDGGLPIDRVVRKSVNFGENIGGNLYYRKDLTGPAQVVVWLHPFSHPMGYVGSYTVGPHIFNFLAEQGYVVMAFDQIGFGGRLFEGSQFYARYPRWSLLGKMLRDIKAAVDFLTGLNDNPDVRRGMPVPEIDINRIYCLGYSLGGLLALYASALDERIAGIASFCGFTPMRSDTVDKGAGGIRRLWDWHGILPWLGLYQDQENLIPYDYDDLMSLVAPRPCLIVSPVYDRETDVGDITRCVETAQKAWAEQGAEMALTHLIPADYNRFQPEQHRIFLDWLKSL